MPQRFTTVFFDLYGTLLDIRTDEDGPEGWQYLWEYFHSRCDIWPDATAVRRDFKRIQAPLQDEADRRYEVGEVEVRKVFAALFDQAGLPHDWRDVDDLAWSFRKATTTLLRPYPGAFDLLEALKSAGLRVVLVSNAQASYTDPELDLTGLRPHLDRIFLSSDCGVKKPDPAFFRMALDAEGADPDRTVMVGNDRGADIIGGNRSGLTTVYLATGISPGSDGGFSPEADLSLAGADYDQVFDLATGGLNIGGDRNQS